MLTALNQNSNFLNEYLFLLIGSSPKTEVYSNSVSHVSGVHLSSRNRCL